MGRHRARRGRRHRLRLRARRRARAARSGSPLPARRRARPVAGRRPARVRLARRRAGAAVAAGATLVIYELHVGTFTPRGHVRRRDRRSCRDLRRARRHRGRAHAGRRVPRRAQLGLRRRRTCSRRSDATAAPTACSALVDACHARGLARDPRRRLQPPRPRGQLPRASSARTSPTRYHDAVGRRGQLRRRRTPTGAPLRPRQRAACGSREYHVDGLRLDAVHAHRRRLGRATSSSELAPDVDALGARLGRRAVRSSPRAT